MPKPPRSPSPDHQPTIPIVAVGPDDDAERQAWRDALDGVIDQNAYCLGAAVTRFEEQVGEFLGVRHAIGVSNGTDAIRLGLAALGVGPGDEVIVPAFTFFATASSPAHLGARPVFVDVDPETLTMSPEGLAAAITPRTRAVIPVHLYGQAANLEAIQKICAERGVPILEDAAQVFGVRYRGRALGSFGELGTFSFYPTKNLGAPGDAGMVITESDAHAERIRSLRVHGQSSGYHHRWLGYNARMDGFSAAVLGVRLERLPKLQTRRTENATHYLEGLEAAGLLDRVRPMGRTPDSDHGWHQFVVRVADRDGLRDHLASRGIQSAIFYPVALPFVEAFQDLGHRPGEFPVAEAAARDVLALPVHHRLRSPDRERVLQALAGFFA